MFLTIDLASKFSAAVLRDSTGKIHWQGDSGGISSFEWAYRLGEVARSLYASGKPFHIIAEDVPYGIKNQQMVKPVIRLQGVLIRELMGFDIWWLNPSTWQNEFDGVGRAPKDLTKTEKDKYRIQKATEHCEALGYSPPDLVGQWIEANPDKKPLRKYLAPLEKQMTDYRDAFLMNVWAHNHADDFHTLVGVQPTNI